MKPQKTQILVQLTILVVGFIFFCIVYLALSDICHGKEPDLSLEWNMVQIGIKVIGGVILVSIILSALNLIRRK